MAGVPGIHIHDPFTLIAKNRATFFARTHAHAHADRRAAALPFLHPMSRHTWVRTCAFLWGAVVFMPVGLNYAGAIFLIIAMLAGGPLPERLDRLRTHPLRWPIAAFLLWTLAVLAFGPRYPGTPVELGHGLRIATTMVLPILLSDEEAAWGLRGFFAGALLALTVMLLTCAFGLPDLPLWHNLTTMKGNKSINDALLFALLGASAATWALALPRTTPKRLAWLAAAFAATLGCAVIVTLALPSRTSLIALFVAVLGACVHQWRLRLRALAVSLCVVMIAAGGLISQAPSAQEKFKLGVQEIEAAQAGAVSEGSWVVRFYMYRETSRMMIERPWAGWGVGSWTSEWHRRAPSLLHDYNMPHNDFLWMGSQTGVPGLLALALVFATGLGMAWRRADLAGRLAFVAMLVLLVATSVNSANRDAAIGLSLPWIVFLYLRRAHGASPALAGDRPAGDPVRR